MKKINHFAQDNNILTAIGFKPDVASRGDNREKSYLHKTRITSENAQNLPHSSPSKNPRKSLPFPE
ncbi:phage polarity suppression protein [Enterobacter soli]